MRYQENKEQSSELLRMALPLMARQVAAHHPVSYAIWYEHVAGLNPPLSEILSSRLEAGNPLTEEDIYRLHARFIAARDVALLERLQGQLQEALDDTATNASRASEHTGGFGRSLQQRRAEISAAVSLDGIRYVINGLLAETLRVETKALELSRELEARASEVRVLTQELQRAQTESVIDPLSGLSNRRGFERAAAEMSGPQGDLRGAALLAADIDHFKQVNDTYGHILGDKVLRVVAQTLRDNIKGRDLAARIGGEEFAILMSQTTVQGAKAVAEQLRAAVAKGRIHQGGNRSVVGSITLSIGVAMAQPGETLDSLMQRADDALYTAKREGRNRVSVAA